MGNMYSINGKTWNIRYVEPLNDNLKRSDNSFTVGMCDNNTHTIYISNDLQEFYLRKVIIHEVTHSAIFSYGIDLTVEQEEMLCDFLSNFGEEIIDIVDGIFSVISKTA